MFVIYANRTRICMICKKKRRPGPSLKRPRSPGRMRYQRTNPKPFVGPNLTWSIFSFSWLQRARFTGVLRPSDDMTSVGPYLSIRRTHIKDRLGPQSFRKDWAWIRCITIHYWAYFNVFPPSHSPVGTYAHFYPLSAPKHVMPPPLRRELRFATNF